MVFRSSSQKITEVHDVIPTSGQHIAASFLSEQPNDAVLPIRSEQKEPEEEHVLKSSAQRLPVLLCFTVLTILGVFPNH